ncbi:oxidoreductase [Cribrihabitans pelagius]|uniref:oxidoreductase n=1 Tax=Cribrihabitans pelagius TaxID=1765746 RepID=UPI003B5C9B4A
MKAWITRFAAAAAIAFTALATAAAAGGGPVLTLRVEGSSAAQQLSLEDLRAMDTVTFETETIWTTGPQRFTGVPLAALAARLGGEGSTVLAKAVNDYAVEIPLPAPGEDGPMVAFERNGAEMPLRGKGPLWVVYPYDSNPAFRTEEVYSRSIWQLDRIELRN